MTLTSPRRVRPLPWIGAVLLVLLLAATGAPALLRNGANLALTRALVDDPAPIARVIAPLAPRMDEATQARLALALLAEGDAARAATVLDGNADTWLARIVPAVQPMAQRVRDLATIALLNLYRQAQAAGRSAEAATLLEAALQLRPHDLYAQQAAGRTSADTQLAAPPLAALLSDVAAVRMGIVETARTALAHGAWDADFVARLARLWLWQYGATDEVAALLELGAQQEPATARWPTLQGEMHARAGALASAATAYRAALALDPNTADAQRGLARVLAQNPATQAEAYALALALLKRDPEDLEAQHITGDTQAQDRTQVVAGWLGAVPGTVRNGSELVRNGDFANWLGTLHPLPWIWNDMSNPPTFGAALFVGGPDAFATLDGHSARVDGLWREQGQGAQGGRAGYWYAPMLMPRAALWLLTLTYRTDADCPAQAASLLLEPSTPQLYPESFLPATDGAWHRQMVLLHNNTPDPVTIRPLVRSWATCTLWIGELSLRPVEWTSGSSPAAVAALHATWAQAPVVEALRP